MVFYYWATAWIIAALLVGTIATLLPNDVFITDAFRLSFFLWPFFVIQWLRGFINWNPMDETADRLGCGYIVLVIFLILASFVIPFSITILMN